MKNETFGELIRDNLIYDMSKYVKLERHEVIKEGALHSFHNSKPKLIMNSDEKTIGYTPSDFSKDRVFYNPI